MFILFQLLCLLSSQVSEYPVLGNSNTENSASSTGQTVLGNSTTQNSASSTGQTVLGNSTTQNSASSTGQTVLGNSTTENSASSTGQTVLGNSTTQNSASSTGQTVLGNSTTENSASSTGQTVLGNSTTENSASSTGQTILGNSTQNISELFDEDGYELNYDYERLSKIYFDGMSKQPIIPTTTEWVPESELNQTKACWGRVGMDFSLCSLKERLGYHLTMAKFFTIFGFVVLGVALLILFLWCKNGWCCCCLCCSLCHPRIITDELKEYYAQNPPGYSAAKHESYQPTKRETLLYEDFENSIKHL